MAVVNKKSTAITNADAVPRTANNSYLEAGIVRTSIAVVEVAAADDDTSTYRMVRLPSNARISSIKVYCDAITGGTSYELGYFDTLANGGLVILDDCYAAALDLSTAITVGTELMFQNRDIDNIEKRAWEDAGLSVDPFKEFDLVFSGDTVGTGAGGIAINVKWTV